MPVRRLAVVACVLALAAAVSSGCSTSGASATGSKGFAGGDGTYAQIAPGDRQQAPDLSGPLVGGGRADLASDRGKVVVLNVWASWCGPCRQEAPNLVAAAAMLPSAVFLGINTKDVASNATAFEKAQRVPYPSFSDQDGSLVLRMQQVVNMSSLPMTMVLDKLGRVAAVVYGPTTAITVKDLVQPLERES